MTMKMTGDPLYCATREDWRAWLQANHGSEKEAWLVLVRKGSTTPCVTLDEATEEAVCFGWIDSIMRRIDDERRVLRFTPRRKGSGWSASNKKRVEKLIAAGRMTEAGLAKVDEAKRNGAWEGAT
jgi:uncharacterized protein YdeI (YjbR/CyaY-like superfamily)